MRRWINSELAFGRVAATAALAMAAWAAPGTVHKADACGGFWCSQSSPVNQTAEQIIFVHDSARGEVTAVIQIQYAGPAEQFAWLLPVPGKPTVSVSSNIAFQNLKQATDPRYQLEVELEGECNPDEPIFPEAQLASTDGVSDPSAGGATGVTVIDEGSVGPYDYVTIELDPSLADAADVAVDWLTINGYDVTDVGPEVLRPYLEEGLNLIAFRLTKGNDSGTIRPVSITYESSLPMIPIRPTRVAAQDDMGVLVYVVSAEQAIPKNYKSLVLNEALVNWFCWQCNYDQVVTAAADESGGQGFVTELGAASSDYDTAVFPVDAAQQWESYSATQFTDGFDAISQARWPFGNWDGFREAVCKATSLPTGVSCDDFGRSPQVYRDQVTIDVDVFITRLYEDVVKPVMDTQDLILSQRYLTRLYTTMSPEEMTTDPLFDFNADLADVSNIHTAKQIIECSPDLYQWQAPWRIELPQGGVIRGEGGGAWPIDVASTELPANQQVVQLGTSGSGEVLKDNRERISKVLFEDAGMTSEPTIEMPAEGMMIGGGPMGTVSLTPGGGDDGEPRSDSGLCAVAAPGRGGGGAGPFALLIGLGLWVAGRRRR
ncbi:MAG: DUF2330 domain-containing protein [Myxococcales bacterium]|nr:DUF2330 domain-containing protein [Myxococcales bacterium]